MITRIDSISNFGIFKSFVWSSVTPAIDDFKKKNIIYGWNYSGKTTLSRIFSSLRDKSIHPDFIGSEFKILTDNGICKSDALVGFPYKVLVFNSDYIADNLKWGHEEDDDIEAIFFEVGDAAKYSTRIEEIQKRVESLNVKKQTPQKRIDAFNEFERTLFTNEASNIKNNHFISLINFTKADVKKRRDAMLGRVDDYIITDKSKISQLGKVIKIDKPKQPINKVIFYSNYFNIIETCNQILSKAPTPTDIIKELESSRDNYSWVKDGLSLNAGRKKCLFCGNRIEPTRIESLNKYFENQASILKKESVIALSLITEELAKLAEINFPSSLNDFNDGFDDDYKMQKSHIDKAIKTYKSHLTLLSINIKQKSSKNLYSSMPPVAEFDISLIDSNIENINILIQRNNDFSANFESIIKKERDKYIYHLVASFLKHQKYYPKERSAEVANIQIATFEKRIEKYKQEIKRFEALKESDTIGCEQLNDYIQSFLNRKDIAVTYNTLSKKFNLKRGSTLAKNLSDGEKMAISFAHFFVTMKSLEAKGEFKNYIVYIDDPISSLDSNHIFQVNSELKDIFFDKIPNPTNPQSDMWVIKCKQLFISTHNFDFFNLLKEMPLSKSEERYYVERIGDQSTFKNLPHIFDSYQSEYHFLFSEIVAFHNSDDKSSSNKVLTMPNVLRRFVEIYTLTQYPSKDELDTRADVVFGKRFSKRICKPFHYFSHFNNIDRIRGQSNLLPDVISACKALMEYFDTEKGNNNHIKALKASIKS